MAKPFVKWLGGKAKLAGEIIKHCPADVDTYIEPFVGGGAVLFNILPSRPGIKTVYINDSNWPLICTYNVIKTSCKSLIKELKIYEKLYHSYDKTEKESLFYTKRAEFNMLKNDVTKSSKVSDKVKLAAALIFLNKTCFNGLYRENAHGNFNSPWGKAERPTICDENNLLECSELFKSIDLRIFNLDFEDFIDVLPVCGSNCFIYFDPPYKPISNTSAFTSYTRDGFNDKDQNHLAFCISNFVKNEVNVVLSNSDHQYIRDIYKDLVIEEVQAARSINSKGDSRGKINELIIHN